MTMAIRNPYFPSQANSWSQAQTFNGNINLIEGSVIEGFQTSPGVVGTWINLTTNGPSGIGSGGAGANAWVAYAYSAGMWLSDAQAGDICYRAPSGNAMRFGGGGNTESTLVINKSSIVINGTATTNPGTTTLAGTSAGSIYWAQPEQGTRKVFIAVADAYENDTATAQTITFPTAYTYAPAISTNSTGLTITATTTTLTITAPNNTTLYNGVVEVVGI